MTQNPPALLWPAAGDSKRALYRVRLSQDSTFAGVTPSEPFEWAAYACHEPLAEGRWYWQWSVHGTRRCGALVGGQCLHGRCFVQAVRHSDG